MNPAPSTVSRERSERVHALLTFLRVLRQNHSAEAPEFQQAVCAHLTELASHVQLWQLADFPVSEGQRWGVYQLHEEGDGTLALYASAARPGHGQPPHNHTTWACIAGVSGVEFNRFYSRSEGGHQPGLARLELSSEQAIGAGDVCFLSADDIHDIQVTPPHSAMHLHLYGRGLPYLHYRLRYDLALQTCDFFPAFTGIPVFDLKS